VKFSEMKETAHNWLADQKLWLSTMVNPESINRDVDVAEGFIDALRLLGIYSAKQAKAAYAELRSAHDEAIKDAAFSADNTESGSKESLKRDEKYHVFSIAITPPDVKWSGNDICRLIQSMRAARISGESIVCILQNLFRPQKERQGKANETA
jgi:hypothetical protein